MWMRCLAPRRTPFELKDLQVFTLQLITTTHFLIFVSYVGAVPGTRVDDVCMDSMEDSILLFKAFCHSTIQHIQADRYVSESLFCYPLLFPPDHAIDNRRMAAFRER
jgi:hypothetical protein